jgi:hypothetical protein
MLLFVDLADHFHDGHEGFLLIRAEDGIVVDHGDYLGKIDRDGLFVAKKLSQNSLKAYNFGLDQGQADEEKEGFANHLGSS